MNILKNPLNFSHYLFVFAHPDDEIYTCVFISELIKQGKTVDILYVTSGDYNGPEIAIERKKEVFNSMQVIGLSKEKVHFLGIPERELMGKVSELCNQLYIQTENIKPDCIISHDFEGGHNGHDAVSYSASYITQKLQIPMFVFPAYHGWPENRLWNEFVTEGNMDYVINFSDEHKILQQGVISSHQTQQTFFNSIEKSNSKNTFFEREVLRYISNPIDYLLPPEDPIGYEYPGSKLKFEDFKKIISAVNCNKIRI